MAKGMPPLRLSPEPWLGIVTDFSEKFRESLKGLADVRAWDKSTFTWWVPSSFMPHVVQLIREHRVAGEAELERARQEILVKLRPTGVPTDELAAAYAMLTLVPSAPPLFVEWAIYFWRRELGGIGAPTTRLLQIEEAYRKICAAQGVLPK